MIAGTLERSFELKPEQLLMLINVNCPFFSKKNKKDTIPFLPGILDSDILGSHIYICLVIIVS